VGVVIATFLLLGAPGNPAIRYAATLPGVYGAGVAFIAEVVISFALMLTVLMATSHNALSRYTPYFVGALYAIFITLETPFSGMSMNPARSLSSALPTRSWTALWIYFTAPLLGMLTGVELYRTVSSRGVACAKLHHQNNYRCIFRCGYRRQGVRSYEPL
jgi:aquaporin Z